MEERIQLLKEKDKDISTPVKIATLGLLAITILAGYGMYWHFSQPYTRRPQPNTSPNIIAADKVSSQKTTYQQPQSRKEWWEEGTLQQATVRQWRLATPANRLATCGDVLLFAYDQNMVKYDMTKPATLRHYARELMNFINSSIDGVNGIEDKKIYELVAAGLILLKLQ